MISFAVCGVGGGGVDGGGGDSFPDLPEPTNEQLQCVVLQKFWKFRILGVSTIATIIGVDAVSYYRYIANRITLPMRRLWRAKQR